MVTLTDVCKEFGDRVLFADTSLLFEAGHRYGIVGANGSGKSTLLRLIAGQETPSEGTIELPRRVRIGVLEQDHFRFEEVPILHVVMMGHEELWAAMAAKEALLEGPEEDFDADAFAEHEDVIMRLDGYTLEARAAEILEGMQIPVEQHLDPLSTLSGGYKLRVLLARTLASNPDLLLLDEPNNHLDILSLRWLEKFLVDYAGCAIIVSHDHRFLDNVCTHIVDVDYERVTVYKGDYSRFEALKKDDRARQEELIARREKEIADHKAFIARFKAKATKARQANSRQKRMEKLVIEPLPQSSRRHPKFAFPETRKSGRLVLEAEGLTKAYGDKQVLRGVDLTVRRGDRLAIIGPNGVGKSTLLKGLLGHVELDAGEVRWGHETHLGYFAQDHHDVMDDPEDTVFGWLWSQCPTEEAGNIYGRLASVLFTRDDADKKLDNLSGGEAARLVLAGVAARKPNVLLLDEPTNHLDLEGIASLARAVRKAEGTVIFVSHDRWFVQRVATCILELKRDGAEFYRGTYREYLAHCATDYLDRTQVVERARAAKKARKRAGS